MEISNSEPGPIHTLPAELLATILALLGPTALAQARRVNRLWRDCALQTSPYGPFFTDLPALRALDPAANQTVPGYGAARRAREQRLEELRHHWLGLGEPGSCFLLTFCGAFSAACMSILLIIFTEARKFLIIEGLVLFGLYLIGKCWRRRVLNEIGHLEAILKTPPPAGPRACAFVDLAPEDAVTWREEALMEEPVLAEYLALRRWVDDRPHLLRDEQSKLYLNALLEIARTRVRRPLRFWPELGFPLRRTQSTEMSNFHSGSHYVDGAGALWPLRHPHFIFGYPSTRAVSVMGSLKPGEEARDTVKILCGLGGLRPDYCGVSWRQEWEYNPTKIVCLNAYLAIRRWQTRKEENETFSHWCRYHRHVQHVIWEREGRQLLYFFCPCKRLIIGEVGKSAWPPNTVQFRDDMAARHAHSEVRYSVDDLDEIHLETTSDDLSPPALLDPNNQEHVNYVHRELELK
jgi:hypothetical protein